MTAAKILPQIERWSAPEAFLGVLTLAAVWDTHEAQPRLRAVQDLARRSPYLKALGEKNLIKLQSQVVERILQAHEHGLEQACAALPHEMRESAYVMCADIISEGGLVSAEGKDFMRRLKTLLQISPALADGAQSLMQLKNRF